MDNNNDNNVANSNEEVVKANKIDKKTSKLEAKKLKNKSKKFKQAKKAKRKKLTKEALDLQLKKEKNSEAKKDYEKRIIEAKKKYLSAKKNNKKLGKEFKSTRSKYATKDAYKFAHEQNRSEREAIVIKFKGEYNTLQDEYYEKFEMGSYKFKRWFFGMGKEFNRTAWSTKRSLLENFIIVAIVILFLALIFFAIDSIAQAVQGVITDAPQADDGSITSSAIHIIKDIFQN